jgi:hypothetical protein
MAMRMETSAVSDHPRIKVVTTNGTGALNARAFGTKSIGDADSVEIN